MCFAVVFFNFITMSNAESGIIEINLSEVIFTKQLCEENEEITAIKEVGRIILYAFKN